MRVTEVLFDCWQAASINTQRLATTAVRMAGSRRKERRVTSRGTGS
jgi:hypothetical protein